MANFDPIYADTLKYEGGFQKKTADTGNYSCGKLAGTNYGISAIGLQQYLGRCVDESDIRNLDVSTAQEIYKIQYWDKIQGDKISDQSVAAIIFDAYIMNPSQALKMAVETVNEIRKTTIKATYFTDELVLNINKCNGKQFFDLYKEKRESFFYKLGGWALTGWINRLSNFSYSENKNYIFAFVILAAIIAAIIYKRKAIFKLIN